MQCSGATRSFRGHGRDPTPSAFPGPMTNRFTRFTRHRRVHWCFAQDVLSFTFLSVEKALVTSRSGPTVLKPLGVALPALGNVFFPMDRNIIIYSNHH